MKGDFEAINLDLLTPPGVPFLVGQGRPSCHSLEIIRKSLFMPLLDSGRHEMSLTLGYLVLGNTLALLGGECYKPN